MLQTKKPGKGGKKSGMKGAKKAAAGGSEGKGKKTLRKIPIKRESKRTVTTPRTRRIPKRRKRVQ